MKPSTETLTNVGCRLQKTLVDKHREISAYCKWGVSKWKVQVIVET